MLITALILFAAAVVFAILHSKTHKEVYDIAGIITGLASAALAVIAVNNASTASGMYITYVNGVRMSQGAMAAGQSFVLFIMFGAVTVGGSRGIGWLTAGRTQDEKKKSAPAVNMLMLVLSVIALYGGIAVLGGALKSLSGDSVNYTSVYIMLGGCVTAAALGVWGIVRYVRRQKRNGKRRF